LISYFVLFLCSVSVSVSVSLSLCLCLCLSLSLLECFVYITHAFISYTHIYIYIYVYIQYLVTPIKELVVMEVGEEGLNPLLLLDTDTKAVNNNNPTHKTHLKTPTARASRRSVAQDINWAMREVNQEQEGCDTHTYLPTYIHTYTYIYVYACIRKHSCIHLALS
jgi:hypothetical protein